jgi:hypothetical protein
MNIILCDDQGERVLVADRPIRLICRDETRERLAATAFRGKDRPLAGNFSRWASIDEMLDDREVRADCAENFIEALDELYADYRKLGLKWDRFWHENECMRTIGWSSTIPFDQLAEDVPLDEFRLSANAHGLRVRRTSGRILAPLTEAYTLRYDVRFESDAWAVVITNAYPGLCIDLVDGDVSRREGIAFFDRQHPGEPLQAPARKRSDDPDMSRPNAA